MKITGFRVPILFSLLFVIAGCNDLICGPGTKQVQGLDGASQCVPADGLPSSIECDAASGAVIVGGKCVAANPKCGPNTTLDPKTEQCIGTGESQGPTCGPPGQGKVCIAGRLRHAVDGAELPAGESWVAVYDATNSTLLTETTSTGTFTFEDLSATSEYFLLVAGSQNGSPNVPAGVLVPIVAGQAYRVDAYVLPRSVVDGWTTQTGTDYFAAGAYIARFYADPKPTDPNDHTLYEKQKVEGVTLTQDGSPAAGVRYFTDSLLTLGQDTATGAEGAAIVSFEGAAIMSGMGGMAQGMPISWESKVGASAPNMLLFGRFHPM